MPIELVAFGRELAELKHTLAEAEKRTDGRNAAVRSLKKRIAEVTRQMAALDEIGTLTKTSLEM